MAIIDMKRGDSYIVRAYRGSELIFERGNPYISRVDDYQGSDPSYSKDTYIHVDDVELMYNWKYEAEISDVSTNVGSRIWCLLGGSWKWDTSDYYLYPHSDGLFFGIQNINNTIYETLAAQDMFEVYYLPYTRQESTQTGKHVVTLKLNTLPDRHYGDNIYQATTGGFHLLSARTGVDFTYGYEPTRYAGEAVNMYLGAGSLYKNICGKVYRISIYDENNQLIHNYVPKIVNNHIGMYDTVISKFYACSDDEKFEIGRA